MHRIGGSHADALHHAARELGRVLIKRAGNVWFPGVRSTGQCNTACSLSAGVWKPKVFRRR